MCKPLQLYLYQTFILLNQVLLLLQLNKNFIYWNDSIFPVSSIFFDVVISLPYCSIILIVLKFSFLVLKSHEYFHLFASRSLMFLINFDFDFFVILMEFNRNHRLLLFLFQSLDYVFLLFLDLTVLIILVTSFKYRLFFD